jgi:hypothetical protein
MKFAAGSLLAVAVLLVALTSPAQECEETFSFETLPGTIVVHHDQALYNCCAWIDFDVDQDEFQIVIRESEQFESGPCDCLCCFDVSVKIAGLWPGIYEVTVWKTSDFGGTELFGPWWVEVDGSSEPLHVTSYLPCDLALLQDTVTWGTIKALYRGR